MVTRLNAVSRHICCGNYFKATSGLLTESNVFTFRKPVQRSKLNEYFPEKITCSLAPSQCCMVSGQEYYKNVVESHTSTSTFTDPILHQVNTFNGTKYSFRPSIYASGQDKYFTSLPRVNCTSADSDSSSEGRPSAEQLEIVLQKLSKCLPTIFRTPFDLKLFHENVILENNFRKTRHVGVQKYSMQISLLRMIAHFKFAYVKFHILKITKHPETGTVKCRWRISGIHGSAVLFTFWQFPVHKVKDRMNEAPTWIDGFSTYYVGPDGLIHKHVIDKMMPDDDQVPIDKTTIAPKVALFLGVLPKPDEGFTYLIDNYRNSFSSLPLPRLVLENPEGLRCEE